MVADPSTNWNEPEPRSLLQSMMITGCDLSAITKPWEVQRMVAEKIASEFFNQGDIEVGITIWSINETLVIPEQVYILFFNCSKYGVSRGTSLDTHQ